MFLDGPVFPLAQKNRNGWGVPLDSVDSAISSLKTSVVRICPSIFGESEHHCDITGSRKDEIGKIVDAYQKDNEVRAVVEITDSTAISKLSDGTWEPTWSVFGGGVRDSDGWIHDYTNESLTFVKKPAWENAKGEIIFFASEDEQSEVKNLKSYTTLGLNQDKEDSSKYYASRIDVALKAERERIEKEHALTDYKNVCASLEIAPEVERFQSEKFTASDVRMHIDLLNKVAGKREHVEAGAPVYTPTPEKKGETPESFQNESGWTVGYFRDGQWFTE